MREIATLELAGNALCLDFANTINSRLEPVHDYLGTPADVVAWAVHAGALTDAGQAARPQVRAAHALRDAVYATFSAIAAGRKPATDGLTTIGAAHARAMAHAALATVDGGRYELTFPAPTDPLWPVARSAVDLLLGADLSRVGECPGCGWLFLDTSRNGSRRWCNMATCGSREKMARFRGR